MSINREKLIIIFLVISLTVMFIWFVLIDNYIIPTIQQEIINSYQSGYNKGAQDIIMGLFQQTSNCQQPTSIWIGNNTKQLIDVTCLQVITPNDDTGIMNP